MSASALPEPTTRRLHSGDYERYAVFAAILLLVIGCYLVIRPFLIAFIWGVIISISTRGLYQRCLKMVGGRAKIDISSLVGRVRVGGCGSMMFAALRR